jgi:hypothetical protein
MRYFQLDLTTPKSFDDAWRSWSGFAELRPAEAGVQPQKIFELDDNPDGNWLHHLHWKHPANNISPVGCSFVRDVVLHGPSIVLFQNQLVGYGGDTDLDNWRKFQGLSGHDDFSDLRPNDPVIDRPVLIADGVAYATWGHWIVDYLPRLAIARDLLEERFDELAVPVPDDVPLWVIDLITSVCDVRLSNIFRYRPFRDRLFCRRAIIPTYSYSATHTFHSFMRDFYRRLCPKVEGPPIKLCVSRGGKLVAASNRKFGLRERFEQMAAERGYLVATPETMFIADQIKLFASASTVIGEHGSGMHSAVFCGAGTVVGCIGFWNSIQLQIGYAFGHQNVYLTRGCIWATEKNDVFDLAVSETDLEKFFNQISEMNFPHQSA